MECRLPLQATNRRSRPRCRHSRPSSSYVDRTPSAIPSVDGPRISRTRQSGADLHARCAPRRASRWTSVLPFGPLRAAEQAGAEVHAGRASASCSRVAIALSEGHQCQPSRSNPLASREGLAELPERHREGRGTLGARRVRRDRPSSPATPIISIVLRRSREPASRSRSASPRRRRRGCATRKSEGWRRGKCAGVEDRRASTDGVEHRERLIGETSESLTG